MKSIILVLLACAAVINCEVVQDKGLATDFLVDNILNPMLQGINQNALNYLLQQLLGKRSINFQDAAAQIQAALQNHKDQIQQALTGIVSTIQNLISTVFPGQKGTGTDFIIDNIVNPMLQGINTNAISFLMQQLLGGLLGKRDASAKIDLAALINSIVNDLGQNLLQSLIITGGSALETLNNQILGNVATTIEQINSAINQIAAELSG